MLTDEQTNAISSFQEPADIQERSPQQRLVTMPVKFGANGGTAAHSRSIVRGAPELGQDEAWVLRDVLGISDADAATLRRAGAFGTGGGGENLRQASALGNKKEWF